MLTTKQVRNILAHPLSYSKATRQDAVKAAIETLDAIAIAKDAKEPLNPTDAKKRRR
jgi:hypothetical protein